MALSNRDRVGKMFEIIAPALDDYIASVIGAVDASAGANWVELVSAKDGETGKVYDPLADIMGPTAQWLLERFTGID